MLVMSILVLISMVGLPSVAAEEVDEEIYEEIIYDILIDRFNNGNQAASEQIRLDDPYAYHGGDIEGIIMKLDDLKELGFTTISLSPIMANAPDGYHGYWVEDFYEMNEEFGTMEDMRTLVEEAHDRDMKVVLEFVVNYAAKTNPIVDDAGQEDWIDTEKDKQKPVEDYPWLEEVVTINQDNPEVINYFEDVATFWLEETDVDGYKLHAADEASPEFIESLVDRIKDVKPEAYIIADILVAENPELAEIEGIQLVENTDLFNAMTDVFSREDAPVSNIYEQWEQSDNPSGLLYVDNKYTKRFTHLFSEQGRNKVTAWKLALTYMYTAPGVPLIYQGSEIPMYGEGVPENQTMVNFNSGDADVKEFLERISSLRAEFPPLTHGDFEQIATEQGMSLFKRTYQDESVYVAINNDSESRELTIDSLGPDKQLRGLLNDNLVRENEQSEFQIGIPRESSEVYIVEENSGINWWFIGVIIGIFVIFIVAVIYLTRLQKKREAEES